MPSPIKPTVWPFARNAATIRAFCCGDSFANTCTLSTMDSSSPSSIPSTSAPDRMCFAGMPTLLQMYFVTASLSPVRTFTSTHIHGAPAARACAFLGRIEKRRKPMSTMSDSSATENARQARDWSYVQYQGRAFRPHIVFSHGFQDFRTDFIRHRLQPLPSNSGISAHAEHFLNRAFGDELRFLVFVFPPQRSYGGAQSQKEFRLPCDSCG